MYCVTERVWLPSVPRWRARWETSLPEEDLDFGNPEAYIIWGVPLKKNNIT